MSERWRVLLMAKNGGQYHETNDSTCDNPSNVSARFHALLFRNQRSSVPWKPQWELVLNRNTEVRRGSVRHCPIQDRARCRDPRSPLTVDCGSPTADGFLLPCRLTESGKLTAEGRKPIAAYFILHPFLLSAARTLANLMPGASGHCHRCSVGCPQPMGSLHQVGWGQPTLQRASVF